MPRGAAPLAFTATAALAAAAVVVAALLLPERVPTHFAADGGADAWSSRAAAVTFLALLTAGTSGLFALLARWVPRTPAQWLNVPHGQWWIEAGREGELRRRLREDVLVLGAGTNVLVLSVTAATVQAASSGSGALPGWWFAVLGLWALSTLAHAVLAHRVRYRPDRVSG
ncbi:DUF1648 domain-containing protein [Kineococcus indalonis]|uniref:DUF1648 domain-containing protein n=1 Tax=Kineococcus indalonis TaxID=2696566 RepID=UPI0014127459|nr:DUF1648 domain-containing protein [Kineococcus indalonis]NAZ85476.1 DUF1648 domain-containing protein [Kineococcus indalonis]